MTMRVDIIDGPLPVPPVPSPAAREVGGAALSFEGIVRPSEDGRPIAALNYEAYEPMATNQMRLLAEKIVRRHGLLALAVEHSRGRVPAGQCAFRLRLISRHRNEGLTAMGEFIDRMKKDVPIWKSPEYAK